jgi:microcystin-dependent protein
MDAFIGQLATFAGNYAPENWLPCNGQLLQVSGNEVLYSLLGTTYGGDGNSTFALPNLNGQVAVGSGTAPGTNTQYPLGKTGGVAAVALTLSQAPLHTHGFNANNVPATLATPAASTLPAQGVGQATSGSGAHKHPVTEPVALYSSAPATTALTNNSVSTVNDGGQPHSNVQPTLLVTWMICTVGLYPVRQ